MGAAAEAMVVGICMVFVRVVGCELCFFVVHATFVMVGTLHSPHAYDTIMHR